ncbi:MAG: prolipoprotein diacylglyceryl transferase [Nanoarchaeota archaeon]
MINFNVNPDLFVIGPFSVKWYGLIFILGFVITLLWLNYYRKKGLLELSKDQIYDLIFYLVIGVVLGSRIFEILFWQPRYYFSNPLEIFAIWKGGLSFHGGLIGASIAGYLFSRKYKISLAKLADLLIIPAVFALALGRIGNLLNSEIYGTITNVKWCFNFSNVEGCRHPYQIYAALKRFLVFIILLIINKKEYKPGYLFWIAMLMLAIGRFVLDFWREDPLYYGLNLGQYLSIILIIISGYVLLKIYRKN